MHNTQTVDQIYFESWEAEIIPDSDKLACPAPLQRDLATALSPALLCAFLEKHR